jgi:hypothetical protein
MSPFCFPINSTSIPTHYVTHLENDCSGGSGDVVIVVPHMDNLPEVPSRSDHSHRICIDAEADMEPDSPKTMTESSSESFRCQTFSFLCSSTQSKQKKGKKTPPV